MFVFPQQDYDKVFEYPSISFASPLHSPSCRSNSVQAVLVDSWKSPEDQEKQDKPVTVDKQKEIPKIYTNHLGETPIQSFDGDVNRDEIRNKRLTLKRPEILRKSSDLSTSSDHIDRGAMSFDMLQTRINSVESALDQIYGKVKGELRDIRDAIKTLSPSTPARTPLWSPIPTTNNSDGTKDPIFSYANLDKYEI